MKKRYKCLVLSICIIICFLIIITTFLVHDGFTNTTVYAAQKNNHTLYVGGSGPNNYTTIQDAINNANNRNTIFVYNGIYNENLNISKTINLRGEDKNTTIIDGENNGNVMSIFSDSVIVSGFTIRHSSYWKSGIKLFYSNNTNISDCIFTDNFEGIRIEHSNGTQLKHNTIEYNTYGLNFCPATYTKMFDNTIIYNIVSGIWLNNAGRYFPTKYTTMKHNNISHNGEGLSIKGAQYSSIRGNTFLMNGNGIYVYYARYNTFSENIISFTSDESVYFYSSRYNNITNNSITHGGNDGITLESSYGNTLNGNTIMNNSLNGIDLFHSYDNFIFNNSLNNNNLHGINVYDLSYQNTIEGNTISHNTQCGIHLFDHSFNTTINKNRIIANTQGILINNSYNCIIYNNILHNAVNALDDSQNNWNISKTAQENIIGGQYIGGNYWSNYCGQDINSDGIGDTGLPHTSQGNIQYGGDWSPLVGNLTYSIDYIAITYYCSQKEIPDISISTQFTFDCYAAAFNATAGFIRFVDAEWSLTTTGSNAYLNSTEGTSIQLSSGDKDGTAQLYAEYENGHADTVIFTIDHSIQSTMIYQGWTYIGWYYDYTTNAESLGQNIRGCTLLGYFEGKSQIFRYHVVGTPWDNFPVTQGMAIFIYSTQTGIWQVER